ncbi:mitochondrial 50S ribosomal protein L5 [Cytidiella melzeri]|nr:mitochondrial 50S ribosomal protein L5 [Cytidiella melzeri]
MSTARVAHSVGHTAARRGRLAKLPLPRKTLQHDPKTRLPIPHVNVILQDTHQSRVSDHYYTTIRDNLMYMSYIHDATPRKPPRQIRLAYNPDDPYVKNRHNPPVGVPQWTRQPLPPVTPENVLELDRIQLHCFLRESITSRSNLLGPIMAFRALSGDSFQAGGRRTSEGVQIVRGKKQVQGWVRRGIPVGVKVDLKGPKMYDFLGTLVDFVLPRLREFPGLVLPAQSSLLTSPSAASGVISFGLEPMAMGLFPQIEFNLDAYPKSYGFHIHFITSARGEGAQNRAAALLSGFQVPFVRA